MIAKGLVGSVIIAVVGLLSAGCSSSTRVASRTADVIRLTPEPPSPTTTVVAVDEAIARACDLPAPHFEFDSANVRATADPRLDKVATCFTTGPLAGRKMTLVGRADPRGETEYNFALGQRRAGNVASYIEQRGVRSAQVATTSRGELDATGTDAQGWARDRRVDMLLAN